MHTSIESQVRSLPSRDTYELSYTYTDLPEDYCNLRRLRLITTVLDNILLACYKNRLQIDKPEKTRCIKSAVAL